MLLWLLFERIADVLPLPFSMRINTLGTIDAILSNEPLFIQLNIDRPFAVFLPVDKSLGSRYLWTRRSPNAPQIAAYRVVYGTRDSAFDLQ